MTDVPVHPTELAGLQALLSAASPGDVVGLMCHAERGEVEAWLRETGATVTRPEQIRAKVLAARGEVEVEVDGTHGSA